MTMPRFGCRRCRIVARGVLYASQAQLEGAAKMLVNAKQPLILAGSGVDRANANDPLLKIVELLNCSMLGTMAISAAVRSFELPLYIQPRRGHGAARGRGYPRRGFQDRQPRHSL